MGRSGKLQVGCARRKSPLPYGARQVPPWRVLRPRSLTPRRQPLEKSATDWRTQVKEIEEANEADIPRETTPCLPCLVVRASSAETLAIMPRFALPLRGCATTASSQATSLTDARILAPPRVRHCNPHYPFSHRGLVQWPSRTFGDIQPCMIKQ